MNKKSSLNNLLYIQEHRSCRNYLEKVENGFKYIEFSHEEVILEKEISWNYLLFVLEGECIINCNQFRERLFQANCMVLLPKTAMVEIKVIAGTRLLSLSFDVPLNVCDKFILQSLTGLCRKLDYNFQSLAIRYPLPPYLEIVTYCLTNKMDCGHFHTLLQQELFFLLRGFYLKEEFNLMGIHLNARNPKEPHDYSGHISCSCHSVEEVKNKKHFYDYVFMSPVYDSISKEGYNSPYTAEELRLAAKDKIIDNKVMALGGITPDNILEVKDFGFGGAVVLGDLWGKFDACSDQDYLAVIEHFKKLKRMAD